MMNPREYHNEPPFNSAYERKITRENAIKTVVGVAIAALVFITSCVGSLHLVIEFVKP